MVTQMMQEWTRAKEAYTGNKTKTHPASWCKPPQVWVKINVVVASCEGNDYIGTGCVIRNDRGEFVQVRYVVTGQLEKQKPRVLRKHYYGRVNGEP